MRDNIAQVVASRKSGRVQQPVLHKAANRGREASDRPAKRQKGGDKTAMSKVVVSRGKANHRKR